MFKLVNASEKTESEPYYIALDDSLGLLPTDPKSIQFNNISNFVDTVCSTALSAAIEKAASAGAILMDKKAFDGGINQTLTALVIGASSFKYHLKPRLIGASWNDSLKQSANRAFDMQGGITVTPLPLQLDYFGAGLTKQLGNIKLLTQQGVIIAEAEKRTNENLTQIKTELSDNELYRAAGIEAGVFSQHGLVNHLDLINKQVNRKRLEAGVGEQVISTLYKFYHASQQDRVDSNKTASNIFWQGHRIGEVKSEEQSRGLFVNLTDDTLLPYFNAGLTNKRVFSSSLLQQIINEHGDDDAFDLVDALNKDVHALGNLTLSLKAKPPTQFDVKGLSISEAVSAPTVYDGLVYGITRPSLYKSAQSVHLTPGEEGSQGDRDNILLAGNQPKTTAFIRQYKNGHFGIHNSGEKDPKTHLLKMPGEHIGKSAALGAREWFSMSLAKGMGVNVPEFGLVDLNKTTDEYVNPNEVDDFDSEWNLGTLKTKRALTKGGLTIGKLHVPEDDLMNDFERNAGKAVEPPGYIIELFSLPERNEVSSKRLCPIDFCTLMGLTSNERFKGSMESASECLRKFTTNFESDSKRLMERFLCSWMIGDGDLHLKNLSMIVKQESGVVNCELSPGYDILSLAGLSGYYANAVLPVNGTQKPTLEDFMQVGRSHLGIEPEETRSMARKMAQQCLKSLGQYRGSQDLAAPSTFQALPGAIKQHQSTNQSVMQMTAGIELSLAFKGVLPDKQANTIKERVKTEQPSVFKESEMLFTDDAKRRPHEEETPVRVRA